MVGPLALLGILAAQDRPDAALLSRLDAILAAPSLVAYRAEYEAAKRSGAWTIRHWERGTQVGFGAKTSNGGRRYGVDFDAQSGLVSVHGPMTGFGNLPANDREDPLPETYAAAARVIRELTVEDREVEVLDAMVDEGGERMATFRAYRRVAGWPVIDAPHYVTLLGAKGERLQDWSRDVATPPIDAETHGHDPTLPIGRLREIARRSLRETKLRFGLQFSQYILETDRIEIALPFGPASVDRELSERGIGVPLYHRQEFAVAEPVSDATLGITLDARDGRVVGTLIGQGRQGGVGGAIPVPATLEFAGTAGTFAPLPMRSATPPGRRVDLTLGRHVFAARFEPGQGTLWISPGRREPYRAYRPSAALGRRLRANPEPGG